MVVLAIIKESLGMTPGICLVADIYIVSFSGVAKGLLDQLYTNGDCHT